MVWLMNNKITEPTMSDIRIAGLSVYTELASMFPDRSGAEVVYLEQAYPRPKFLVPVSFAVTTVLLSYVLLRSFIAVL